MGRLFLFLFVFCSACASNEEYPNDWSPIVFDDSDCPDISGTYDNVGLYASRDKMLFETGYLLSNYVFEDALNDVSFFAGVVISRSDGNELRIAISSKDKTSDTHTLSREMGHFACEGGKIWIAETTWGVHQLYGPAYAKTRIGLAKTKDGSLVGEIQTSGVGAIFVVIPVKWSSEDYVRWSRFDPEYWDAFEKAMEEIW